MLFLMYMVLSTIFAVFFTWVADKKLPNPILLRCSGCGSKLHMRPKGKWGVLERMIYAFAIWLAILRLDLPVGISIAFVVIFVFAWGSAVESLTHAYWTWRHPLRCDGGGHTKAVPQPT